MRLSNLTSCAAISLALPCASWALGLGDIEVQTALGQPLTAQIEIVGATANDLAQLRATIADDETFKRHGIERPSFLSATALIVGQDKLQRPVLLLRSTESFNEPAITFLVDVHSPSGELVREYTILLDPPGLTRANVVEATSGDAAQATPAVQTAEAVRQSSRVTTSPQRTAAAVRIKPATDVSGDTYRVATHDTLDRIVRIAGAHSRSDRHRMMIAIFRANPQAFASNLNNLHSAVTLHLPNAAQLSAISADEANREFTAQMSAWQPGRRRQAATAPTSAEAVAPHADVQAQAGADANVDADANAAAEAAKIAALNERLAIAQQSLERVQQELNRPLVAPTELAAAAASTNAAPDVTTQNAQDMSTQDLLPAEATAEPKAAPQPLFFTPSMRMAIFGTGLSLVLAAGVWFYLRRRPGKNGPPADIDAKQSLPLHRRRYRVKSVEAINEALNSVTAQLPSLDGSAVSKEVKGAAKPADLRAAHSDFTQVEDSDTISDRNRSFDDATVELKLDLSGLEDAVPTAATTAVLPRIEARRGNADQDLVFNPEATINTTHVTLTGDLNEEAPFGERRKNPADVLRQAIEKEPNRTDLRLKLLELYYVAATQNQRAFLEVAREIAKHDKLATAKEWAQVVDMGRKIAPRDKLFSDSADQAVA